MKNSEYVLYFCSKKLLSNELKKIFKNILMDVFIIFVFLNYFKIKIGNLIGLESNIVVWMFNCCNKWSIKGK